MATQIVRIHFFLVSLQTNQSGEIATISTIKPDQKVFVNGKEVSNDQPVKISKIEVIENTKINQSIETETESKTEPDVKDQLNASQLKLPTSDPTKTVEMKTVETTIPTGKCTKPSTTTTTTNVATTTTSTNVGTTTTTTPIPENPEESIVTPDYIQQSKLQPLSQIHAFVVF